MFTLNVTLIIIIATVLVSMQGFQKPEFMYDLSFSPYDIKHRSKYYKFFTYMFVHSDWPHLIFNMFSFYFLGSALLYSIGGLIDTYDIIPGIVHFLVLYFVGGFFSTLWPMARNQDNPSYTAVGASGAVSAVVFAMILWRPDMELSLMFIPIPIKAYIFGPLYLAFEFWAFKRGKTNIAHDAHIGGAIFGVIYVLIINIDKGKEFFNVIFK